MFNRETKAVLEKMMKTSSGTHFLDSGGAYGRQWQRNQKLDLEALPATTLKFEVQRHHQSMGPPSEPSVYINVTHSAYHWLAEKLNYEEELDKKFHRWASLFPENREKNWLLTMEDWTQAVYKKYEEDNRHGDFEPMCVNTYNGEDLLDHTLQYIEFELEGSRYVALSIHTGADVRGGYSIPHIFSCDEYALSDNARAGIGCKDCDAGWYTDDANNWYPGDGGATTHLENYDVYELEEGLVVCERERSFHEKHQHGNDDPLCHVAEELTPKAAWKKGVLLVHEGRGFCPKCGGELLGGTY